MSQATTRVFVFAGEALARYHFGEWHPFGPQRHAAFYDEFLARGLDKKTSVQAPMTGGENSLSLFHDIEYIARVKAQSRAGSGFLDFGDTPALPGIYEAALTVVGTTLAAVDAVMAGECRRAFVPIAGLHHARRDGAAGFCVFNDCGVAIEHLRKQHGLQRIAYIDIDAHHGDGVNYGFETDADLIFVDFHEDGRYLYPGTGDASETGVGVAKGTKLNIPMPPGAGDAEFFQAWEQAEAFIRKGRPEFILLQCGADSLADDPITHLRYSAAAHAHAAKRLCLLADEVCQGRMVAMGGGGYNLDNIARAWNAVVEALLR